MDGVRKVGVAALVLVVVWGVLGGIGWLAGAFPPLPGAPIVAEHATDVEPVDAGADAPDGGVLEVAEVTPTPPAPASGETPAPAPENPAAPETPESPTVPASPTLPETPEAPVVAAPPVTPSGTRTLGRFIVCDGTSAEGRAQLVDVLGDPRPELFVACGARAVLIAIEARDPEPEPLRVATLETAAQADASAGLEVRALGAGDVNGDGLADLLVGLVDPAPRGAQRAGALFFVPRDAPGGFARPVRLGAIAPVQVALADLDGRPGLDVVALHVASPLARRPSEAWVFTGGAVPARKTILRTGVVGEALALADLDHDGHEDVIAAVSDEARVDVFFGDGAGAFPRTRRLAVAGVRDAQSGDFDGDGFEDVLLSGDSVVLLPAGAPDELTPRPVDVPAGIHHVRVADVDGDGRRDLVGIVHPEVVWLRHAEDGSLDPPRALFTADARFVPRAVYAADLDADAQVDLVMLGSAPEADAALEVVLLTRALEAQQLLVADTTRPLRDAPLTLRVPLR